MSVIENLDELDGINNIIDFRPKRDFRWAAKKAVVIRETPTSEYILLCMREIKEKSSHTSSLMGAVFDDGVLVAEARETTSAVIDALLEIKDSDNYVDNTNPAELEQHIKDTLQLGLDSRASDIHFVLGTTTKVFFRVDGDLVLVKTLSGALGHGLMTASYIAYGESQEERIFNADRPYFWTMSHHLKNKNGERIQVRVRCQSEPCAGEISVVWRLLPIEAKFKTLDELGYLERQKQKLKRAVKYRSGLIVLAGTTGSGKSTTLASMLHMAHQTNPKTSIRTVESPVEYNLPFARQRSLDEKTSDIGRAFAEATSVKMRLDPDILMIGEVRCPSSAKAAVDAVSTGHLVLTTIHAASANQIKSRLARLGVDREVLDEEKFLLAAIYQKLIKKLCPDCKVGFMESKEAHDDELVRAIKTHIDVNHLCGVGDGCSTCNNKGYIGRTVVSEMMLGDNLEVSLIECAIEKMKAGEISPGLFEDAVGPIEPKEQVLQVASPIDDFIEVDGESYV